MDFALIFIAMSLIALFIGAAILIGVYAGPVTGIAFFVIGVIAYRLLSRDVSAQPALRRDELNAFQKPLAED